MPPSAPNPLHFGTKVNDLLYHCAAERVTRSQCCSSPPCCLACRHLRSASFARVGATVQARAIVRIVSAVTLRLGDGTAATARRHSRRTRRSHTDGEPQPRQSDRIRISISQLAPDSPRRDGQLVAARRDVDFGAVEARARARRRASAQAARWSSYRPPCRRCCAAAPGSAAPLLLGGRIDHAAVTVSSSLPLSSCWRSLCVIDQRQRARRSGCRARAVPSSSGGARNQNEAASAATATSDDQDRRRAGCVGAARPRPPSANGLNSSSVASATGGSFQSAAEPASVLPHPSAVRGHRLGTLLGGRFGGSRPRSSPGAVCVFSSRRPDGVRFAAVDHRLFVGALFGFRSAARLDQCRFGDRLIAR